LEAVLQALDVSAAESALAFASIPAPRAHRHLKTDLAPTTSSPLTCGDLLRAMRLRQGWTQVHLAQQIGVSPQALARWELSERQPSTEQIQTLCFALGAREEELIALTTGAFANPPDQEARTWEEAEVELKRIMDLSKLKALDFYLLDRKLWGWSLHNAAARHWLMRLRINHARYYGMNQHWSQAEHLARKAREAVPEAEMGLEYQLHHVLLSAQLAVHSGQRPAPERGIRRLTRWVEPSRPLPEFHAWILADIARYATMQGAFEGALSLSEQSCARAERAENETELWLRQSDYGVLLVEAGRAGEALKVLPNPYTCEGKGVRVPPDSVVILGLSYLAWAEAEYALGHLWEAQDALSHAQERLETRGMPVDKERIAELAARL
jgi:transcriptional regulator with XRE-family HTH domain